MEPFTYHQPTEIIFGSGRVAEVGELVARFGKRCLIVSRPKDGTLEELYVRIKEHLRESGVEYRHYGGVIPNPTTDSVRNGTELAQGFSPDVVLGVGGGSSMDTAKAIAVELTHPGTAWDYLWCSDEQPTEKTLPVVSIPTTSGTGSQVTQVAVVTNTSEKTKSAIFNDELYPEVGLIDPELMVTVPTHVTASTGFDVFGHAFESYLHVDASPYTDILAREAVRLVTQYLPQAVEDGSNKEAREGMAWADCLAGLCIANAGVTLPHGIGMTIGGYCPHVMHGEALAVTYPEFTRFTYPSAVKRFADMGRVMNPDLEDEPDEVAAERACEAVDDFLKEIGMWLSLEELGVSEQEVELIADDSQVLPDYKNNPRVATRDEIYEILTESYRRE